MANENNNMNELVAQDDDPTAELEALDPVRLTALDEDMGLESGSGTCGYQEEKKEDESGAAEISELESDLRARSEKIARLQFDIEHLRTKWNGLETEIKAREEIAENLNRELAEARETIDLKEKGLRERDLRIDALTADLEQRDADLKALRAEMADAEETARARQAEDETTHLRATQQLELQAGQLASDKAVIRELRARVEHLEAHADALRHKLAQSTADGDEAAGRRDYLDKALTQANERIHALEADLEAQRTESRELQVAMSEAEVAHVEELRQLRFELGEAQETVSRQEEVSGQLAADLMESRGRQDELEKEIGRNEKTSKSRIKELEQSLKRMQSELAENQETLAEKNDAINCLIAELAKKSQQLDSINQIEDVIQEIDTRMSERIDDKAAVPRDRLSRVLIGVVEGQELRFPLFKNRLTIGRSDQNDIQIKATFVSRRHAVVATDHDATRIIDWGSKNGVYVNSRRVSEQFLNHGDTVTIGGAEFRYEERAKRDT
jgi:chromosome segregation ATPase